MLKDKKILLGITGGIAAYKAVELASRLTSAGAAVKTIMTAHACEFIRPLTLKSITHQPVITAYFDQNADIEHISLADWADILVVAPATANIIGKTAGGIADDLLSTTLLAVKAPVLFVPSMNVHMYDNPLVKRNIEILSSLGYQFLEPTTGSLACGYQGKGRYPENQEIIFNLQTLLHYKKDLRDKKVLITAGATRENIDPMRFITNNSSGLMGLSLARAAYFRGAEVSLITAHTSLLIPYYLKNVTANSAEDMYHAVTDIADHFDLIFMTAAVSDYTPAQPSAQKIKKGQDMDLKLKRTRDILENLGNNKPPRQTLVGFAAESENIVANAREKLTRKKLDFIVANDISVSGKNDTTVNVLSSNNQKQMNGDKFLVAHQILDFILYG